MAFILVLGTVLGYPSRASAYKISSNMQWWSDDRFGMFIHLGAYSYYGHGEWAMSIESISKQKYQTTIAAKFNPVHFNAKDIVANAKKAGMKYIVITAKHHEGLAMWDTQVSSFTDYTGKKIFSLQQYTPFGATNRDILMELKEACDAAGLKFGLYYSIVDWNHPSQQMTTSYTKMSSMTARANYIRDMKAQLQELVTRYDPAVMWFDGTWMGNNKKPTLSDWWTKADGKDLYQYMKKISPNIIVNERVCNGFGLGDFDCPEQTIPTKALSRPWETCQTMNDAWGYDTSREKNYRVTKYIIRELVEVASKNGNYLLNVGPKGDGSLTAGSKKVLKGFAKWMKKYGSSIYKTTGSPFKKTPSWGMYTRKGKTIYVHVLKWPKNGKLTVKRYKNKKIKKIYIMDQSGKKLKYSVTKGKVTIKVPKKASNKTDTVLVMKYS